MRLCVSAEGVRGRVRTSGKGVRVRLLASPDGFALTCREAGVACRDGGRALPAAYHARRVLSSRAS